MHAALLAALAATTFLGHFSLAVWLFNRLHAKPWPRKYIGLLEKVLLLSAATIVAAYAWRYATDPSAIAEYPLTARDGVWQIYAWLCRALAVLVIPLWLVPKMRERTPAALVKRHAELLDMSTRLGFQPIGSRKAAIAAKIPGNEILRVSVERKTLAVPSLLDRLEGLTIAHLSDLHMTGKLTPEFYHEIVDRTNAFEPDLIAITGDIAETEACIDWIKPTLGRLRSRLGVYFVLGNHEQRLRDPGKLRRALVDAGCIDLGSRCEVVSFDDVSTLIAGNEMPWFGQRPDVAGCLANGPEPAFRLLLSHTPDEYAWARENRFDLMLAGHNHGGQIRLPLFGALITPSRFGCRYAGGLYDERPTLMHVSRGIAGLHSVRFNCPPELALLTLTRARVQPSQSNEVQTAGDCRLTRH